MQREISIFLVNSDHLFCEALRALVATWPGYFLVGTAATVRDARTELGGSDPDIVLVDIDLPGESGFTLLQFMADDQAGARPVVLTRELHPDYIREAIRLGARAYISYRSGSEQVRNALCAVDEGRIVIDPLARRALADDPGRDGITDRECQVLAMIAEGACNAEIAERLGITEKTVKTHVSNLLDKLGMLNRVHLAVYAEGTSLIKPPPIDDRSVHA